MSTNPSNWNSLVMSVTKLNDTNYSDWKFALSMLLRRAGLWELIAATTPTDNSKDAIKQKNEELLTIIGLTVEPSQYQYINSCTGGVSAWNSLAAIYQSSSRANRIALKQKFYGAWHDPSQPIDNYIRNINDLAHKLKLINVKLEDNDIIDVLIFNLNDTWSDFAGTLAATQDDTASFKTVCSLLRAEDVRRQRILDNQDEKPISTFQATPFGKRSLTRNEIIEKTPRSRLTCYRCNKIGHIARDCTAPKPAESNETSNLALESGEELEFWY